MKKSSLQAREEKLASVESVYSLLLLAAQNCMSFEVKMDGKVEVWSKSFYVDGHREVVSFPTTNCTEDDLDLARRELDWQLQKDSEERAKAKRRHELLSAMSKEDKELLGLKG